MTKIPRRPTPALTGILLRFANSVREQLGKKPVTKLRKGRPGDPECCVLANTIGGVFGSVFVDYNLTEKTVSVYTSSLDYGDVKQALTTRRSPRITRFLSDFDNGEYPGLEKT